MLFGTTREYGTESAMYCVYRSNISMHITLVNLLASLSHSPIRFPAHSVPHRIWQSEENELYMWEIAVSHSHTPRSGQICALLMFGQKGMYAQRLKVISFKSVLLHEHCSPLACRSVCLQQESYAKHPSRLIQAPMLCANVAVVMRDVREYAEENDSTKSISPI